MTISGYFAKFQKIIYPGKNVLLIGTIAALGFFSLIWAIAYWLSKHYVGWLVVILTLLTIPKIMLIGLFKISPVSDIYSYTNLGGSSASGDSWRWMYSNGGLDLNPLFPSVIHISSAFGWIDRLFINKPFTIQLFNILITLTTAVLIYYFGRQIGNHFVGILSSLLFYLIPTYYIYSVLPGYEPLWLLLLVISSLCFNRWRLGHWQISNSYYWGWLLMTIVSLILAQLIRPLTPIWVLSFFFFTWMTLHDNHISKAYQKTRTPYQLAGSFLILIIFTLFLAIAPKVDRQIYHIPFTNNSSLYSFTVGSNVRAKGMYDLTLINKLEKINRKNHSAQRYNQMNVLLKSRLKHNLRYLQRTNGWLNFLIQKNKVLSQSFYGIQFFVMNTKSLSDASLSSHSNVSFPRWLTGFTTGFQIILILSTIIGILFYWPNLKYWRIGNGIVLMAIILDGVLLASCLVEVQSRYQIAWYLPMIILGALGMGKYDPKAPDEEDVKKIEEAFDEAS
ncbi:hypothetical protein EFP95_12790 [Lentilactobacillus hilgardii]|nr:hypothetical protein [Lentilactobacillus hilgardii]